MVVVVGDWRAYVVRGVMALLFGIATLIWPDITLWALAVAAGAALLVSGALHVLWALGRRHRADWAAQLAVGALGIVLGLIVLAWPDATLVVLAVLLGIRAVVTGLIAIATGWQLHRLAA